MTVCPIAIVAGCKSCPVVSVCPLKSTLGDYTKENPTDQSGNDGEKSTEPRK